MSGDVSTLSTAAQIVEMPPIIFPLFPKRGKYNQPNISTSEPILKTIFGYDTFKPLQREIINNVVARRDTLFIMPTGGGKSLTYQVPALMFDGLTVVVSPLIALSNLSPDQQQRVFTAFDELGTDMLKPVYEN